jgi:C4-dicarboxylate transporter, DctM subunit
MLRFLDRLEEIIISTLIAVATVVIFIAVMHRYATGVPALFAAATHAEEIFESIFRFNFSAVQELCIYLFVWMAKFGAAYGVRTGIHVGVDVLVNMLGVKNRSRVILLGLLAGALFTGIIGTLGTSFVWHIGQTPQRSNDLEIPMWIVYLAIPLGSYLMCFRFLQVAWSFAKTGELPVHDHGHVDGVDEVPGGVAAKAPELSPVAAAIAAVPPNKGFGLSLFLILLPIAIIGYCFMIKLGMANPGGGARAGLVFALLVAMMLTGMPISIALGLTVLTFMFTLTNVPVEAVALKLFTGIEKFEIMAIPFFILAGNFLTHGGVAKRMINFATSMVGHMHGGLGLSAVMGCALFAAVSGSSPATVVAIGSVILPAMVQRGFPPRFGAGIVTTSGALGILIPPSIAMVLFAVSTGASVGKLFIAGVIPGLTLAFLLGLTTWWIARKNGYPRAAPLNGRSSGAATRSALFGLLISAIATVFPLFLGWIGGLVTDPAQSFAPLLSGDVFGFIGASNHLNMRYGLAMFSASVVWLFIAGFLFPKRLGIGFLKNEAQSVWQAYWSGVWGLLLILIVIGGIYAGLFTPTEAAAMSAVYAFVVALFVYRDIGFKDVPRVLLSSANMSAMLLYIITNAVLFSFLMTHENIPQAMAGWMIDQGLGWITFLLVVNILLLLAGNVMEPSSIILIMAPILFPVAVKLGIDPIHFGILMVVNMEIGMCHPPVGLNLYVASGIAKMGITELTVAVWPWLLTMLGFLVVVTYWPGLSLWLPHALGMK